MLTRRRLLGSVALCALWAATSPAGAWIHGSAQTSFSGYNVLPLGCGGLTTGFDILPDGTVLVRSDVGGCYRFSGTISQFTDPSQRWVPLMTYAMLGSGYSQPGGTYNGAYELVGAPTKSSRIAAILPNSGGATYTWALCISDGGSPWVATSITMSMSDGGSNGPWRRAAKKIAFDPNNEDVIYCGIQNNALSGSVSGAQVSFDGGATFNPVSGIGPATSGCGGCGFIFDKNYGTVVVGGQLRTKRVILPVGGVGIFESLDGGVTFSETAVSTIGRSDICVPKIQMDYDGVLYAIVGYNGFAVPAHLWRYSGPAGTWVQLDGLSGAPSSTYFDARTSAMFVDPRNGHQGFITVYGANGIGVGYTSTNANATLASSVTWGGGTGGQHTTLTAPSYDCPWLNHVIANGTGSFADASESVIDQNGNCWWSGDQGAMWLFTASDLTTPVIPNFAVSTTTYSVSTSRGTEITVAQDAIDAPGAPYPVIAAQDVGIFQTAFDPTVYPTDFYPSPARVDCETLEYAASDPSFYVGKVNREVAVTPVNGGAYAAYSPSYGATGSWVPYAVQPDLLWCAQIVGGVAGGVLTISSFVSGTGLGNTGLVGQVIYPSAAINPSYGTITAQLTGTPGGVGTYSVTGSSTVAPGTNLALAPVTTGGQIVAVDPDHHVCCITHNSGNFVPGYTANARSPSNTWQFCNGLPSADWMLRGYNFGPTSRPFAVGYGVDLGTVWAVATNSGTATLYRSTDSGANFSSIASFSISVSVVGIYLLSVPGFPNELWLSGQFTGGSGTATWHITNANTSSATVTPKANPASRGLSYAFTMGAPATSGGYPALYLACYATYGSPRFLYQGDYNSGTDTLTWSLFAHPNGNQSDLPDVCQIAGYQSIRGSWNKFGRLLVCSQQSGFAYYEPP